MNFRPKREVQALFDGFELVEPGVVRLPLWRPESPDDVDESAATMVSFGGVGRKG